MIVREYEREGYSLDVTKEGGYIFLHIHLDKVTPKKIRDVRVLVEELKASFLEEGHDVVFATTPNRNILKMWQMIEPCYQIVPLEDSGWLGSWLTEEI